ncbi:MAG: flotillin-like protein FloA [Gemmatimonadales bacterium]|nr:flotillin-like protein FloA [Gemmatimonadota bacterium]MCC7133520.1 flotillin-like protein FloA [Gemmatimonadales bacterium]MDX2058221.1 flotillin-like protein FloA [Gemmatimonadales bacterium]
MDENTLGIGLLVALVIGGMVILSIFFRFVPIGLWFQALVSGVRVSFLQLFFMRFRKVDPASIVNPLVNSHKAGLALSADQLESHYLSGGNVARVVNALISAGKAGIPLDFKQATAIDLAGRDVFEAVQVSVNPKVITTPKVAAMAKDGIQLLALARVTVRANINRLVGGAGEETILARVGEGIVSTIGSAVSHKAVLENPDMISKTVLAKGLDAGTAFEILSIDIADVDVGKNIGAELQTDQAEADKRIAQAKAEERRALAVAMEQEYKAGVQKERAKLVAAEAEIPMAMAEAFRRGTLGVMDYQRYRNLEADTQMRQAISGQTEPGPSGPLSS